MSTIKWDNGWKNITQDDLRRWAKTYPGVRIRIELRMMSEWLWSNASRRPRSGQGAKRFITNWLKRTYQQSQERAERSPGQRVPDYQYDPPSQNEVERSVQDNTESVEALRQMRRELGI